MAEASDATDLTELRQLTSDLSTMLYEDHLNTLVKKFEEVDDKSALFPEVQRAMQACLKIQDFLKDELGSRNDRLTRLQSNGEHGSRKSSDSGEDSRSLSRSAEMSLGVQNPSSSGSLQTDGCAFSRDSSTDVSLNVQNSSSSGSYQADEDASSRSRSNEVSLDVQNPSGSSYGEDSMIEEDIPDPSERTLQCIPELSLEEANPSSSSSNPSAHFDSMSANPDSRDSGRADDSHGFKGTHQSMEFDLDPTHLYDPAQWQSNASDKRKTFSATSLSGGKSLDIYNPSSAENSPWQSSDYLDSEEPEALGERDTPQTLGDTPMLEPSGQPPNVQHSPLESTIDEADWKDAAKFHVVLRPLNIKPDSFTKVDLFCSSPIRCRYFSQDMCQYTTPVEGEYEFVVVKMGHPSLLCRLQRDDGKKAEVLFTKMNRGSSKIIINWQCSRGQRVWVEGKGKQTGSDAAVVFSGSLLSYPSTVELV